MIWANYSLSHDIDSYIGSAGGDPEYTTGVGWEYIEHTWVFAGGDGNALVIEDRLYSTPTTSNPDHTDFWVDYIRVTAPEHATMRFPGAAHDPVGVPDRPESWSRIKSLYQ